MAALDKRATIAVVGAGSMGAGIAQVAAAAGHLTLLFDTSPEAVSRAIEGIGAGLERLVERGKITPQARDELLLRIKPAATLEALSDARLVVEAIVEDLRAKQQLFARLEKICARDVILASNTSSLSISAIASALARPGFWWACTFSIPRR